MNGSKRSSFASSKNAGKFNGKLKDTISTVSSTSSSSTRHNKSFESRILDTDLTNMPLIKQGDNPKFLPKYTAIAAKGGNEGVSMDDLDHLQQEFEKLLNTCALRIRHLLGENVRRVNNKASVKRRRLDISRLMDMKSIRDTKKQCVPTKYYNMFTEVPKVALPRNDHSDKFWASIEPYCAPVTKDDVAFLDRLIQECSKEIPTKIPEIDEHYASTWSEDILNDELNSGKSPNKKNSIPDLKKNGIQALVDTFSTPITQRLLAASIEENLPKINDHKDGHNNHKLAKLKSSDFTKLGQSTHQKIGICLEERLKKELVEQGILTIDDIKNGPEDEILLEIKKCQQELSTVNAYNIEELTKLKSIVLNDIHSNDLKAELEKVDRQVLELYNKIISQQEEGEGTEREPCSDEASSELEQQADALLKQQIVLNREINSLSDMSLLY